MSYLQNVDDLRADALFRAGESPTDTNGSFWTKSLEYLNRVQLGLLMGGGAAVGRDIASVAGIYAHLVDLPITDWWWLRKKGVFNTVARTTVTVNNTLTQGVTQTMTLSAPLTSNPVGLYVVVQGKPTVYRVQGLDASATVITLDAPYVDDTTAGATVDLAQMEYQLPSDFIRFASTPYVHSVFGASLDVSSIEQRNTDWPLAIVRAGRPTRAFMVGPNTLAFNGYDTRPYRVEYEYINNLPKLVAGGPVVGIPQHHRQVLSSGASMLIAFDKGDSKSQELASEYRELVGRMVQEHRRSIGGGSSTFCQFRVRKSGIPKRAPQSLGEIYLV